MSVKNIVNQLKHFKERFPGLSSVWFTDDTMFIKTIQELKLFAKEYKEEIDLPFKCYVSPNTIDEEKLELLLIAGLSEIEMGIQTGSEDVNKNLYNRDISNIKIFKAAEIINKYKTKMRQLPSYQIIYCNPYETEEDLKKTIAVLQKLPLPFYLQIFNLQFFPASELYKKAKRDGLLKKTTLINYHDHKKALLLNTKNSYLNFLLYLMNGLATSKKMGSLPRYLLPILINKKVVYYLKRHDSEVKLLISRMFGRKTSKYKKICEFIFRCVYSDTFGRLRKTKSS